jgi:hypothetical protein
MVCPPEVKPTITLQDLAREGVPIRTLRYHAEIGALIARKIGPRRWYVDRPEAEKYLGRPLSGNANNRPLASAGV